jgi:hypothetical protein
MYETDQKRRTFGGRGRVTCKNSLSHYEYQLNVQASWVHEFGKAVLGTALATMRVFAIVGARTVCHTDAFGGDTLNYFLPHGSGCKLKIYKFPEFRSSFILYKGYPFIPLSYSVLGFS